MNRQIKKKNRNVRVVMGPPGKSKKKQKKDSQRRTLVARYEQKRLVESGLVTQEDIDAAMDEK